MKNLLKKLMQELYYFINSRIVGFYFLGYNIRIEISKDGDSCEGEYV